MPPVCITRVTSPKKIYTVHDIPASQLQIELVYIKGNGFFLYYYYLFQYFLFATGILPAAAGYCAP